jgi:hypothetical protein
VSTKTTTIRLRRRSVPANAPRPTKANAAYLVSPERVCPTARIRAHSDPSGRFDILPQMHLPAALCKQVKEWRKYHDNFEIVFDVFGR